MANPADHLHPTYNKVKFVNKQLYAETAGLEIRFNALLFSAQLVAPFRPDPHLPAGRNTYRNSAEQWFFTFIAPMTPRKLEWLSTVIIATEVKSLSLMNPEAPAMLDLPALAMFCKQHPKIDLRYQFQDFNIGFSNLDRALTFLTAGMALTTARHGNEAGLKVKQALLDLSIVIDLAYIEAQRWREVWNIKRLLEGVENFIFWPTTPSTEGELSASQRFKHQAESHGLSDTDLNDWLRYGKMWTRNGI